MEKPKIILYVEDNVDIVDRYLRVNGFECNITSDLDELERITMLSIGLTVVVIADSGHGNINSMAYDTITKIVGMCVDSDFKIGYLYSNELFFSFARKIKGFVVLPYDGCRSIIKMLLRLGVRKEKDEIDIEHKDYTELLKHKYKSTETFMDSMSDDVISLIAEGMNGELFQNFEVKDNEF